jgi:hypothetical protein
MKEQGYGIPGDKEQQAVIDPAKRLAPASSCGQLW